MENLLPTLSPTPLTSLPVVDQRSVEQDVGDFIRDSPVEMRPYLHNFNQLLTQKVGQLMQTKDLVALIGENDNFIGEQNDHDFTFLDPNNRTPFPYPFLRMIGRSEPARLIKNNRIFQLREFGNPSFKDEDKGMAIVFENPDYVPTADEKAFLRQLTIQITNHFFFAVGHNSSGGSINLGEWLGMAYEDWFDLDDIAFEIRRNGWNKPLGFHLIDPSLIKTILPKTGTKKKPTYDRFDMISTETDILDKIPYPFKNKFDSVDPLDKEMDYQYMLMKGNRQRLEVFTKDRMVKAHFFKTTEYRKWFRGLGICEQGVRMITNITNSINYNASNFNNDRLPRGVLSFMGGLTNRRILEYYRRLMYSYFSGSGDKKRFPIFGLPENGELKWIPIDNSSREMEFHLFITLLYTVLAQLSGTSPEEIGLSSHENAMRGSQPFDKSPDGVRQISRDKGLNTFLYFIADEFNKTGFLKQISGMAVKMKFNGLIVEDKKARADVNKARLETTASINDMINETGGTPQTLMIGKRNVYDIPGVNNPAVMEALQMESQKEEQENERKQQSMDMYSQQLEDLQPMGSASDQELVNDYGAAEG